MPQADDAALRQLSSTRARTTRGSRAMCRTACCGSWSILMKMGPDQRQLSAGALRVREVAGGQGAAEAVPQRGQSRQDHAGAGLRHHRLRPRFLRASAEAVSAQGHEERLRGQAGQDQGNGLPQRHVAGRLSHHRGAALGLDCGPMSGFDNAGVDAAFFAGTAIKSNFLCNLGYGDPSAVKARLPRFTFDEMAKII